MEVRIAVQDDVENICRLYNEFFEFNANQQPQYYKETLESGKYPKSVINSNTEDIFIAIEGNEVIGFIHISEDKTLPFETFIQHKFANVIDLFVESSFRKKGVGKLLLDSAKQWAKIRELDYLELNVLAQNKNGIQFYEYEKFEIVSYIMRCTL